MVLNDRQAEIMDLIKENGRVSTKELSKTLFVSEMTVRRDLTEMEKCGYLKRYKGGAVYMGGEEFLPVQARVNVHYKEKRLVSAKIKKYLKDGMTVFIDSSSTCEFIIPLLKDYENVLVVTNSVFNMLAAAEYHIKCLGTGGEYDEHDMCFVGAHTDEFLRNVNVDIAFFSARGISSDGVITDSDVLQTSARKAIMKNSLKNVFLFDGSKKNKKYPYTLARAEDVDEVITI